MSLSKYLLLSLAGMFQNNIAYSLYMKTFIFIDRSIFLSARQSNNAKACNFQNDFFTYLDSLRGNVLLVTSAAVLLKSCKILSTSFQYYIKSALV